MSDTDTQRELGEANVRAVLSAPPARRSPWTRHQKLVRLAWGTIARPVWWLVPGLRPALIRAFGGRVGTGCRIARDVEITIPWNVSLGDRVRIGERAILYSLGPITIGDDTVLDYAAHVCAGTHDFTDTRFTLLKVPITIGARCFVGIDAYLAPGITLGDGCVVLPRASVYKSFGEGTTIGGNPGVPSSAVRQS